MPVHGVRRSRSGPFTECVLHGVVRLPSDPVRGSHQGTMSCDVSREVSVATGMEVREKWVAVHVSDPGGGGRGVLHSTLNSMAINP